MCLRRVLLFIVCVVALLYLVRQPVAAANTVNAIMHGLERLADALGRFGRAL